MGWPLAVLLSLASSARAADPHTGGLAEKEAFMLMFGKGNGAMRVLCALERDGVISAASRRLYGERLEQLVGEPADSAADRRHVRVGMAFATGRSSLCLPAAP
ncbi:MAG: hypothetical protein VKI63_05710 [Cyanobium sp.]|nr:hypothetical protein [Cyanobium sp.]